MWRQLSGSKSTGESELRQSHFVRDHTHSSSIDNQPAIKADIFNDPDDDGHTTICFTIKFKGSVDEALELDERVKNGFIDRIPPEDRLHLSVNYDLE